MNLKVLTRRFHSLFFLPSFFKENNYKMERLQRLFGSAAAGLGQV